MSNSNLIFFCIYFCFCFYSCLLLQLHYNSFFILRWFLLLVVLLRFSYFCANFYFLFWFSFQSQILFIYYLISISICFYLYIFIYINLFFSEWSDFLVKFQIEFYWLLHWCYTVIYFRIFRMFFIHTLWAFMFCFNVVARYNFIAPNKVLTKSVFNAWHCFDMISPYRIDKI